WHGPIRENWCVDRTVVLVEVYPDRLEIIKVSAETETGASAFESLRFCTCRRVLVVGPFLPDSGMGPEPMNRHLGNNHDLSGDSSLLFTAGRATLEVLRHLDVITAGPAPFAEYFVQTIGVRSLIGICDDLTSLLRSVFSAVGCSRGNSPFDFLGI